VPRSTGNSARLSPTRATQIKKVSYAGIGHEKFSSVIERLPLRRSPPVSRRPDPSSQFLRENATVAFSSPAATGARYFARCSRLPARSMRAAAKTVERKRPADRRAPFLPPPPPIRPVPDRGRRALRDDQPHPALSAIACQSLSSCAVSVSINRARARACIRAPEKSRAESFKSFCGLLRSKSIRMSRESGV